MIRQIAVKVIIKGTRIVFNFLWNCSCQIFVKTKSGENITGYRLKEICVMFEKKNHDMYSYAHYELQFFLHLENSFFHFFTNFLSCLHVLAYF